MRKFPLKRKTPPNKVSKKQRAKLKKREKLREGLQNRSQGHCEICGRLPDWRGLSLHHQTFLSQGGEDSEDNGVMACGRCHSEQHGITEK